ncbi:hypothetical protein V5O48_009901 [Marasmius crinis-equi]|uniref:Uncharacterized protein n=1 Tax=Marasmius crinis-equi TaxID=585013 RepID=A0ABR3FAC2_9AGAR
MAKDKIVEVDVRLQKTKAQKARAREEAKAQYRKLHREELNKKARERMASLATTTGIRLRAERSDAAKKKEVEKQKEWSRHNYLKNRHKILDRATKQRRIQFVEKQENGNTEEYPARDVRPRNLLVMKDDPLRKDRYEKALWRWKSAKDVRKRERENEKIDRKLEQEWRMGLDDIC